MKYLVTAQEMKRYDGNTITQIGIPGMVLMERAALFVLDYMMNRWDMEALRKQRILILAGVGNNGGDGLALARLLADKEIPVKVCVVGNPAKASEQWKLQRAILENYAHVFGDIDDGAEYNIVVDALFGVGLSRNVEGEYAKAIEWVNGMDAFKIALDVPSGIDSDKGQVLGVAVKADVTLTFGFVKRGLVFFPGCEYAGEVLWDSVGITPKSFLGEEPAMFAYDEALTELLPKRRADGNKGTFGKVLLIAGSKNMAGAAILSARAAYGIGAGMVKVLTPEVNRIILQEAVPEALLGDYDNLEESLRWADVIAIGCGLGQSKEAGAVLRRVITESDLPLVIDADGLNLLAADKELQEVLAAQRERIVIMTPHVGELARLMESDIPTLKKNLATLAMVLAEKLHAIIVAKDARTFICQEGKPVCANLIGNSGMATAGSGDVLTGMIAGLLAQQRDGFYAASVGTYAHAWCGDVVAERKGKYACMAGDIAAVADSISK